MLKHTPVPRCAITNFNTSSIQSMKFENIHKAAPLSRLLAKSLTHRWKVSVDIWKLDFSASKAAERRQSTIGGGKWTRCLMCWKQQKSSTAASSSSRRITFLLLMPYTSSNWWNGRRRTFKRRFFFKIKHFFLIILGQYSDWCYLAWSPTELFGQEVWLSPEFKPGM